jgi:hypothetical protein
MSIATNRSDEAFAKLQALGAGEFVHLNGPLSEHLRATEKLLREWGNREPLCIAGLYHAVYGTDAIEGRLVGLDYRTTIAGVVGPEAEEIAYLYGACARKSFHGRIGTPQQQLFTDRFTQTEYQITPSQLRDFCELTIANELELAVASEAFRSKYGAELAKFFRRMKGLVSDAAFRAVGQILCLDVRQ